MGMLAENDLIDIREQDSDKSSVEEGQENNEDLSEDDMSEESGTYFDSSWSDAESALY